MWDMEKHYGIFFVPFLLGDTQGLSLARQVLYHLSQAPSPFCFSYFSDRVSLFAEAWPWTSAYLAGITGVHHHVEMRSH
jgi:hypothetical protein